MSIRTQKQGFSLVETLVAITILLLVVVGPMTIIIGATRGTNFSSEQVTAAFLSQEGLELVQNMRDDLVVADFATGTADDSAWQTFVGPAGPLAACVDDGAGLVEQCGITFNTDATATANVVDCKGASVGACQLYLTTAAGTRARYTHASVGADQTPYTRVISITPDGVKDVKVTSRVTWRTSESSLEQEVETVTYLYNVYGR